MESQIKNGYHVWIFEDGSKYEGEWKDDKKHGKGIFYRSDGSKCYEGDYKDDIIEGYGIFYWQNGDKYEG
jgi:hypothetical protein